MKRLVLILYFANLLIIGSIIGMVFAKESPESLNNIFFAGSSGKNTYTTFSNQIGIFSIRLKEAAKQTTDTIYHKWIDLLDFSRVNFSFSNIGSFLESKRRFIVMEDLKETKLPVTAGNNRNLVVSSKKSNNSITEKQLGNRSASIQSAGRSDPFLPLHIIKPAVIEPEVDKSPISTDEPANKEPILIEEKPKVEKNDLKLKLLKNCHLRGIVIGNFPIAYIEDQNGYRKVTVGDFISEGQIVHISETGLTIRLEGEQFVLGLEE